MCLCRSFVFMCVCWFSVSLLDELNHTEILQVFGATSENTNTNYANISVSFLQVYEQQHLLVVSVHLELKISASSGPLLWFPSSWYHFDLLIRPARFHLFPCVIPLKGQSGLSTEMNALWTVTTSCQWRVWSDHSLLDGNNPPVSVSVRLCSLAADRVWNPAGTVCSAWNLPQERLFGWSEPWACSRCTAVQPWVWTSPSAQSRHSSTARGRGGSLINVIYICPCA